MKISRTSWLALAVAAACIALIVALSLRQSETNGERVNDLQSQFTDAHDSSVQRQGAILDKLAAIPTDAPTLPPVTITTATVPGPAGPAGPAGADGRTGARGTTTVVTIPARPATAPAARATPPPASPQPSPTTSPVPHCPARLLGVCLVPPG